MPKESLPSSEHDETIVRVCLTRSSCGVLGRSLPSIDTRSPPLFESKRTNELRFLHYDTPCEKRLRYGGGTRALVVFHNGRGERRTLERRTLGVIIGEVLDASVLS